MFDPYHKWLGIPKDQRPPTYYQVLGIAPGETDAEVIDEAAVRQTTHVRAYQIGAHAADCTRILNEIAQAKLTLLNSAKRKAYDEQLAKSKSSQITAKPAATATMTAAPAPAAFRFDEPDEAPIAAPPRRDLNIAKPMERKSTTGWVIAGAIGVVVVLLSIVVIVLVSQRPPAAPPKGAPVVVAKKDDGKPINKPPVEPKQDKEPPIVENPPPIKKPPVVVQQPPINPPAGEVAVPGARSFKVWEQRIEWMSLSPDGSKVALGFLNPSVYEVATGKQLVMFPPRKVGGNIHTPVAFLPDNARLLYAYGSESGDATVGDVASGKVLFVLEQEKVQYASALAVDRDGKRALVAHNYRLVYWDLETQREIKSWNTKGIVDEVIFTPDGHGAVTAEKSGVVVTWDLDELKTLQQFKTPPKMHALAIMPDGSTVACGAAGVITLIDLKTRQMQLINNQDFSGAVAFCSGGKQILVSDTEGAIRIFDLAPVKQRAVLKGHKARVNRIAVDARERIAVSADNSGRVVVWPLGAALLAKAPPPAAGGPDPPLAPPPGLKKIADRTVGATYRLAILPDGKSFLSGGLKLTHWDISGMPIREIAKKGSTGFRLVMNVSADGRLVAWGENKDDPTLFDIGTGAEQARIPSDDNLGGLALSPDGTRWCAGFNDKSFTVWDIPKKVPVQQVPLAGPPFCMAFAPDGKHLLVSLISGQTQWYDTTTWQSLGTFNIAPFPSHPAFTSDGQTLAMASAGRGIVLIDTVKLQPITDLPHKNVQHLAFCAKGQLLIAAATSESWITVWDPVQRTKVALWELPEPINSFAVDRQETFVVAVTRSGHAFTWPLPKDRQGIAAAPVGPAAAAAPPAAAVPAAPQAMAQIIDKKAQGVFRAEILPDGASFITGGMRVEHWDIKGALRKQLVLRKSTGDLFGLALTPDGKRVLWGENLDSPQLMEIATGEVLSAIDRPSRLTSLSISPDGKHALAAFGREAPVVWDIAGQKVVRELPAEGYVATVAFCPLGKYVLRAQLNGPSKWLDRNTWEEVASFNVGPVFRSPAFTADGKLAALPTSSQGIVLMETGGKQANAIVPVQPALQVAFCAQDALLLARPLNNKNIQVWDVATQTLVATWELPHQVSAFAVNRDASEIVAITMAGNAYTWPLPKTRADLR